MGKLAFIFPGQGAQVVGMGKDLFDRYDLAKQRFVEADAFPYRRPARPAPEK